MNSKLTITPESIDGYRQALLRREHSSGTVEQYTRTVRQLSACLRGRPLSPEALLGWKKRITGEYRVTTANAMIAAVNGFLDFCGLPGLKLKCLRCQQRIFRETELAVEDYRALLAQARREGDTQTALLLEAMACTGVRVSELRFLTVESLRAGMAVIRLKGKVRQIPLSRTLCRELLAFARQEGITAGAVFLGSRGRPLDRRRVWERLKRLCAGAGVEEKKVHPHALRHFFARMFYRMTRDIVKLADILGLSSVNTTRIYTATSPQEHRCLLDTLAAAINEKSPPRKGGRKGQNRYFVR